MRRIGAVLVVPFGVLVVAWSIAVGAAMASGLPQQGDGARAGKAMVAKGMRLEPVTFDRLPYWAHDDQRAALDAYVASCPRVIEALKAGNLPGRSRMTPETLAACDDAVRLAAQRPTRAAARAFFEDRFIPHRVVHGEATGLMTGYFEPEHQGSRTPGPKFSVPVYRRPPELVNLVDETMRGAVGALFTHARKTEKGLEPFATRSEIEQGHLKGRGLELIYLADAVDVFFMQIQGSGLIRLPGGETIRLGYDGKNGHPYTSVGRHLIDTGQLSADGMSLDAMGRWLRADPERGRRAMWQNKSYVFFRELTGAEAGSAQGVLKIPLRPGRSLAVDAGHHTIGSPIYVSSPALAHADAGGFHRLMVAHDVGSAIRGPERGDIYFGSGTAAGKLAGVTKHPGNFYVLVARPPDMAAVSGGAPKR